MNKTNEKEFEDDPLDLSEFSYLNAPDAIVIAANSGNGKLVKHLIKSGHDINLRDEDGCTALFVAVEATYYGLAIYLLNQGADPNITNKDGDTPLDIAKYSHLYRHSKDTEMVDALINAGGKCKDGPSAKELLNDQIYSGFSHANAMKNLFALIEKKS